jgi:superfamily II DNA or RNA helicase
MDIEKEIEELKGLIATNSPDIDSKIQDIRKNIKVLIDNINSKDDKNKISTVTRLITKFLDISSTFSYFPLTTSSTFMYELNRKKEFNTYYTPFTELHQNDPEELIKRFTELADEFCSDEKNLMSYQNILRNFMSPKTQYNSMLLFHGTGSGKTCTSLSIAEQFKDIIQADSRKIYVVASALISKQFRKALFDKDLFGDRTENINIEKYRDLFDNQNCTKSTYFGELINDYGSRIDVNYIDPILKKYYYHDGPDLGVTRMRFADYINTNMNSLYSVFNNSVIIIDEVHNIHEMEGKDNIASVLENMFTKVCDSYDNPEKTINIILLLLSATPMKNSAKEILYLTKLLLLNTGEFRKAEVKTMYSQLESSFVKVTGEPGQAETIFSLSKHGERLLENLLTGKISYVRSENPFAFPIRLYPRISIEPKYIPLTTDFSSDTVIREEERVNMFKLYPTYLSETFTKNYYKSISKLGGKNDLFESHIDNLIFLNKYENIPIFKEEGQLPKKYTDDFKLLWRSSYHPLYIDFLGDIAPKLKTLVELINQNKHGTIFIYTNKVEKRLYYLAAVLEANGITNFIPEDSALENTSYQIPKAKVSFKYAMLTSYSKRHQSQILKTFNSKANRNGEKIKILIGSKIAQEGINTKNIREIHILDPWWNISQMEQVIGRGLRNCSHTDLDFIQRNTTIFHHVAFFDYNTTKNETIDYYIYRRCELKQKYISRIEKLLQRVSIDCNLNMNRNYYDARSYKHLPSLELRDSHDEKITYKFGDTDYSKHCFYERCEYFCKPAMDVEVFLENPNTDTSQIEHYRFSIYSLQRKIKKAFNTQFIWSYWELLTHLKIKDAEAFIFDFSLYEMVENKIQLFDKYERSGTIIHFENKYMFKPDEITGDTIRIREIYKPTTLKKKHAFVFPESQDKYDEVNYKEFLSQFLRYINSEIRSAKYDFAISKSVFREHTQRIVIEHIIDNFPFTLGETKLFLRDIFFQYIIEQFIKSSSTNWNTFTEQLLQEDPLLQGHLTKDQIKHLVDAIEIYFVISDKIYNKFNAFFTYEYKETNTAGEKKTLRLVLKQYYSNVWSKKDVTNEMYLEMSGKKTIHQVNGDLNLIGFLSDEKFKIKRPFKKSIGKDCNTYPVKEKKEMKAELIMSMADLLHYPITRNVQHTKKKGKADVNRDCLEIEILIRYVSFMRTKDPKYAKIPVSFIRLYKEYKK